MAVKILDLLSPEQHNVNDAHQQKFMFIIVTFGSDEYTWERL